MSYCVFSFLQLINEKFWSVAVSSLNPHFARIDRCDCGTANTTAQCRIQYTIYSFFSFNIIATWGLYHSRHVLTGRESLPYCQWWCDVLCYTIHFHRTICHLHNEIRKGNVPFWRLKQMEAQSTLERPGTLKISIVQTINQVYREDNRKLICKHITREWNTSFDMTRPKTICKFFGAYCTRHTQYQFPAHF